MTQVTGSPAFRYYAFISYSHQDKLWADWLHKTLETYAVPKRLVGQRTAAGLIPRRLTPIFRDRDELASAHDLGRNVNEALAQSANLIVICSPRSAVSHWVQEEVLAYKRLDRSERIFCLIVDGEPNTGDLPGREAEECFAPALRFNFDTSGETTTQHTEPIAADARAGKDGRTNAKLKLIAGMLEVGFDALKQRELRRRARRMTAVAALALVVMVVTSVLAVAALISRHDAVIAQHKAVVARQAAVVAQEAAERRQKQAENLVGFMLGDLTTKLRQVDRLDILSSVDDKAMAYFKSLPLTDVNAASLAQRAKALQKIGDVRMNQSRLSDSMDALQQALRINRRLVGLSPNDPARQNAYGENLLWVGFNYWQQGKLDRTETAFKQATIALEHAADAAPDDNDVQHNLDDVYNNLGHVAKARGELDAALADYLKDLALDQRMAKAHPVDVLWQNGLADAYGNLGTIALARGRMVDAVMNLLKSQQQMAKVVANDPNNRQMQDQLLPDDAILGRTLALAGYTRAGLDYVKQAAAIGDRLIAFDPSHTDWQDNYAYCGQMLLGHLLLEQGDIDDAIEPTKTAFATETTLVTKDPGNAEWRNNLAEAQLQAARLALARRHPGFARQFALQAHANMQKLLAGKSSNAALVRIQAEIELLLGELAANAGDAGSAANYRQRAIARMHPFAHSSDPRNLSIWVDALLASGNTERAEPIIEILRKMGYRPASFVARMKRDGVDYPENAVFSRRIAQIMSPTSTDPGAMSADRP